MSHGSTQNLVNTGHSLKRLFDSRLPERDHASLNSNLTKLFFRHLSLNSLTYFLGNLQQFEETHPALVLPLSQHFGLDLATTLDLGFWMYLLFGITALPWGILADKFGPRPLLALFYLGGGCSGLAAAAFVDKPFAFQLSLIGIGIFSGIYHPTGLGWIAVGIPRTAAAMAINGIFGSLGLAMGPLLAGLINWLFGI